MPPSPRPLAPAAARGLLLGALALGGLLSVRHAPDAHAAPTRSVVLELPLEGGLPIGVAATLLAASHTTGPATLHTSTQRVRLAAGLFGPHLVEYESRSTFTIGAAGLGGFVELPRRRAICFAPDASRVARPRRMHLPATMYCDPVHTPRPVDRLRRELADFVFNPHGPPTPVRVLFVTMPAALVAVGGDPLQLSHAIDAAFGPTNHVFGESPIGVALVKAGVVAISTDSCRTSLDALNRALGDPTTPLGQDAAALRERYDAEVVCLVAGPPGRGAHRSRHAGHATIGGLLDPTRPATCVLRVHELRSNDATLGHELAHVLGWVHE